MPEIIVCQKVRSEITALQALDNNTIALTTKHHGIRIFQADRCQNKQILFIPQINHRTTAIAMHPTENICAVANENAIHIISLTNKTLLQTIYTSTFQY